MKRLSISILLVLLISSLGWAGRISRLTVIGFSDDGKYIAYQILGPYTDTGTAFSIIQIVDIVQNDFAVEEIITTTGDEEFLSEDAIQSITRAKAEPLLEQFGIIEGNGGMIAYRLDRKVPWEEHIQLQKKTEIGLIDQNGRTYEYIIELSQRDVESESCSYLDDWNVKPRIFTLSIRGQDWTRVLQRDTVLYRSRACAYTYTVSAVHVYGDKIAVFLDANRVAWEGDDVNKLIVTGTLDRSYTSARQPEPEPVPEWRPSKNPSSPLQPDPAGEISLAGPDGWGLSVEIVIDDSRSVAVAGFFDARVHQERFTRGILVPGALNLVDPVQNKQRFSIKARIIKPDGSEVYRELSGKFHLPERLILQIDEDGEMLLINSVG